MEFLIRADTVSTVFWSTHGRNQTDFRPITPTQVNQTQTTNGPVEKQIGQKHTIEMKYFEAILLSYGPKLADQYYQIG